VYEIFLNEEKLDETFSFKEAGSNLGEKIQTNFSQTTLNMFKNQEQQEDGDEETSFGKIRSSKTESYAKFEDGLKLRIKKEQRIGDSNNFQVKNLVFVETTKKNLNKIVMSIITDNCIVIDGPLSSGKTTLIEYLASKTNNKLIKYQMDEYMDSKVFFKS
jgi:midasin (ATPase involved in ribosome maturation)